MASRTTRRKTPIQSESPSSSKGKEKKGPKKQAKPNCYDCKYRGEIPGDAHSCCQHPKVKSESDDPLGKLLGIFAGVGRIGPIISEAAADLGIKLDPYGIVNGWANWPWNFDPTWLDACDGFEKKD